MMDDDERERFCERLAYYFGQRTVHAPEYASNEITVVAKKIDGVEYITPLTWGEVLDVVVPVLEQNGWHRKESDTPTPDVNSIDSAINEF